MRDWLRRDQAGNATHGEVKAVFDKLIVPEWKGRHIGSICRRDVIAILDSAADRGRVGRARHLHAFMNRFFNWCVGRGIIDASPMAQLEKPGESIARDRTLSDAEIVIFWKACKAIGWPFGTIGQILLLTAARRSEIANLRHDEVDANDVCIRLGGVRTKNAEAHIIPLSPLAWRILASGPRVADSPFVFPSGTGATPFSAWSKTKTALDQEMRLNEPWRLHDLRRTAATGLEALGTTLQVTEAILNHVSGSKAGVAGIYQRYKHEPEKRAALAKWSGRVLELVAA